MSRTSASFPKRLRVQFGQSESRARADAEGATVALSIPHLAGPDYEDLITDATAVEAIDPGSFLLSNAEWQAGMIVRPHEAPLEQIVHQAYRTILERNRDWYLCRIWNYIPDINLEATGLENYRRFNLGRWQAYQDVYGQSLHRRLTAASAVGVRDAHFVTVFLASRFPVEAVENPEQMPAWQYPEVHGPKAPSFARASVLAADGNRYGWVSGTASIKGHDTVAPGDISRQLEVTLDNLRLVLTEIGFPELGSAGNGVRQQAKVYLRDGLHLDKVRDRLARAGIAIQSGGPTILKADICRRELELEIEISCERHAAY